MGLFGKTFGKSSGAHSTPELEKFRAAEKSVLSQQPKLNKDILAYLIVDKYLHSVCPEIANDQPVQLPDSILQNGLVEAKSATGPRLRKLINFSFSLLSENTISAPDKAQLAQDLWTASEYAVPRDGAESLEIFATFWLNATSEQASEFLKYDENLELTLEGIDLVSDSPEDYESLIPAVEQATMRVSSSSEKRLLANFTETLRRIVSSKETPTQGLNTFCVECGTKFEEGNFCTNCGAQRS